MYIYFFLVGHDKKLQMICSGFFQIMVHGSGGSPEKPRFLIIVEGRLRVYWVCYVILYLIQGAPQCYVALGSADPLCASRSREASSQAPQVSQCCYLH